MSELSDLFASDPLRLTKDDRSKIIEHMRANRAAFMAGQRTTSVEKASKKPAPARGSLKLEDLDI